MEFFRHLWNQSARLKTHQNNKANKHRLDFDVRNESSVTALYYAILLLIAVLFVGCKKNASSNSNHLNTRPSDKAAQKWVTAQIAKQSERRLEIVFAEVASRQEGTLLNGMKVAPIVLYLKVRVRAVVDCGIMVSALKRSGLLQTWDLNPNSPTYDGNPIEKVNAGTTFDFEAAVVAIPLSNSHPLDDLNWSFMWTTSRIDAANGGRVPATTER